MSAERDFQAAQRHYQEARRNWMIVGALIALAVFIDVVRDREGTNKKRKKMR